MNLFSEMPLIFMLYFSIEFFLGRESVLWLFNNFAG